MLAYSRSPVSALTIGGSTDVTTMSAVGRPAARSVYLGLNKLSLVLLCAQLATLVLLAVVYISSNLTILWSSALPIATCFGVIGAVWLYLLGTSGRRPRTWVAAESLAALMLILSLGSMVAIGQYVVALFQRPLVAPYLASADWLLGVSVPGLVAWTREHTWLVMALRSAYLTLAPQVFLAVISLGVVLRDRDRLWELAFHYHFCLLVTLAAWALFPAECASSFYGFDALIDQTRLIRHVEGLRAATMQTVRFDDLEGLVSFPSFHTAGALMVMWAFRRRRAWLLPLIVLNTGLIAATFMTGVHYIVDVMATFVVFAISIWAYRHLGHMVQTPDATR
jgi:hypothetical protein